MVVSQERSRADHRPWRLPIPLPWGRPLGHTVSPLHLLDLPLAFTQNALLSPSEFVDQAAARGVRLRVEQLLELHHRHALIPLFRIRARRRFQADPITVAESAADGYRQYRSNIALVVEAALRGQLADPAVGPFRSWEGGLVLPTAPGRKHRYPSVFYSPYQLIALRAIEALVREMEGRRDSDKHISFRLAPLEFPDVAALDGCRQLAILLSALDMYYLPRIVLRASHSDRWQEEDEAFDLQDRLATFVTLPETIAAVAEGLLAQAHFLDPLGSWYDLIRHAHPDTWSTLKGDARLAMDYRVAAEVLLRALDDLGRVDLSTAPPRTGRMAWAVLDDRLGAERMDLDAALTDRGLSPHPALLLVLEGKTEMTLMPQVLAELYGGPVPPTLIECVDMASIDRDLDLLVRHVLGPRFGRVVGDAVELSRPPTRILIAVDPEKDYETAAKREEKRRRLVSRLHEALPSQHRTPESRQEIDSLVQITTWGAVWEFANFTDAELATGILATVALPDGVTREEVAARVALERVAAKPNIEVVTAPWGRRASKVALATALTPGLLNKVRRGKKATRYRRLPAGQVAVPALRIASSTHRRHVVMRVR
jgi:hypothetical protein